MMTTEVQQNATIANTAEPSQLCPCRACGRGYAPASGPASGRTLGDPDSDNGWHIKRGHVRVTRLGILSLLAKGPKNVTALCKGPGLKQPTVSHHLGLLRMGRLVVGTRKGKAVEYATDKANLKALASALGKLMPK